MAPTDGKKRRGRPPLPPEKRKPRLTGGQRRALEKQAKVDALLAQLGELGWFPSTPASVAPEEDFAAEFAAAGEPDLENPSTDLSYVRKLQLIALRQMASTANPPKVQIAFWQRIKDMAATVGMTHPRAAVESEVKQLKQMLAAVRASAGAVKMEPGNAVPRPTTARGSRSRRGPRPLQESGPGTPPGEDA